VDILQQDYPEQSPAWKPQSLWRSNKSVHSVTWMLLLLSVLCYCILHIYKESKHILTFASHYWNQVALPLLATRQDRNGATSLTVNRERALLGHVSLTALPLNNRHLQRWKLQDFLCDATCRKCCASLNCTKHEAGNMSIY
jgi:hypothetical protein